MKKDIVDSFFFFWYAKTEVKLKKAKRPHRIQKVYQAAPGPQEQQQEHLTSP